MDSNRLTVPQLLRVLGVFAFLTAALLPAVKQVGAASAARHAQQGPEPICIACSQVGVQGD